MLQITNIIMCYKYHKVWKNNGNLYHLPDIPLLYFFTFVCCIFFYKENRKIIYLSLLWLIKIVS